MTSAALIIGRVAALRVQRPGDRDQLCRATGRRREEVERNEIYAGSDAVYNFLTEATLVHLLLQRLVEIQVVPCGRYVLAERRPLLVAETAA